MDKSHYTLFNPTPRRYLRPLVPDRPGLTESPYSVDAGHFQYEADVARLLTQRQDGQQQRTWYVNHALLKLGLTDRTDFQAQVNSYTTQRTTADGPAAPTVARGFGDLTLRLKHTLVGDDDSRAAVGLIGFALLPTGGAVGEGGAEYGAVLPAVVQLTKTWSAGGQVEFTWAYDRDAQQHYGELMPTLTTDYQFSKLVQAFVEVVAIRDWRQHAWLGTLNFGPQVDLSDNVQLDFGAHLPLSHGLGHEYFLGLSFRR